MGLWGLSALVVGLLSLAAAAVLDAYLPSHYGKLVHVLFVLSAIFLSMILVLMMREPQAFVTSLFVPFAIVGRHFGVLLSLPTQIVGYFVRQRAWPLFRRLSLGLDGFPIEVGGICIKPPHFPDAAVQYEELRPEVRDRVLRTRDKQIGSHVGAVSALLSQSGVRTDDLTILLSNVYTNVSLVHAAYYQEEEYIDRIARWIAGKN
jgi:hypothetical protein